MDLSRKFLLSVDDASTALSLGRTVIYQLINAGELASVKIGRSRRIPVSAIESYLEGLIIASSSNQEIR